MRDKPNKQFSTFKEDFENIGIHLTDKQYSDLCDINLFMKGITVKVHTGWQNHL